MYKTTFFLLALILTTLNFSTAYSATDTAINTEPSMLMASMRVLWGLLIVLGIIFAIYAFAKKKFNFLPGNNGKSLIKIIETRHLMPKKSIYLIDVRGKEYLLGVSDNNINLLSSIDNNDHEEFQSVLEQAVNKKDDNV